MASSTVFNLKQLKWNIYSYINDIQDNKDKFSQVIFQLKYKIIYNNEVIPRLAKGTRFTIKDEDGLCSNCYHYGPYPEAGSISGRCMNHVYQESGEVYWMTFKEFKKISRSSFHYNEYEEYEFENKIKFRKMRDDQERLEKEAERQIQEYYRNMRDHREEQY